MPGPRTYTTVLGGEGRKSPQNLSRNGPGVQRCRKCETSPPPYPDAKPGLLQSVAPHRLPRIAAILRAHRWSPELEERSSGKTEPRRSIRIRAGTTACPCSKGSWAQVSRGCRPRDISQDQVSSQAELRAPSHHQSFLLGPPPPCLTHPSRQVATLCCITSEPGWCTLHLAFCLSFHFLPSEVGERLKPKSHLQEISQP